MYFSTLGPIVFDRFHRVAAVSRSHEGTGIGLALTKELVRLHAGQLTVTSQPQQQHAPHAEYGDDYNDALENNPSHGSTFTVTIPTGHSHIPTVYVDESSASTAPVSIQRSYARGIIDEAAQ